jgi:hypothetical protein
MDELTVICFYWLGTRWREDDLGSTYVNKLYRGVRRNLSTPHRFVCFTNEPKGIECETRPHSSPSWLGCLPRLWQYSEESGLTGQVLSLDIDLIIVGSLDDLASYRGEFCVRSKFRHGHQWKADGDVIGFKAGGYSKRLWSAFAEDPVRVEQLTKGMERYWIRYITKNECDRWDKWWPNQIVSYKRHIRRNKLKDDVLAEARIVSCHGRPRPHEINAAWIEEHWR